MPYASKIYPTTDENLHKLVKMYKMSATNYDTNIAKIAQFILDNRKQMKFRIQHKITVPHGNFRYQIYLKKDVHRLISDSDRESLWRYLENNSEHCLVTNKYVLDYLIGKYPYCYHGYFYVSEAKMLSPIYMIAQKGIDKVMKFVQIKNGNNKKITK